MSEKFSVPVNQIGDKLAQIWESFEGTNKMRACLFNLIMYVPQDGRSAYFKTVAEKVIRKFPSRVIVIKVDESSSSEEVQAEVSVMLVSEGECDIACDLIELSASKKSLERIPFITLPLVIPDLPTYFLCAEDPLKSQEFTSKMLPFCTRLIFDSESSAGLKSFCKELEALYDNTHLEVADLNWGRLESWRDLITSSFQRNDTVAALSKISSVKISYNKTVSPFFCHTKIQSLYLQAWLASNLEWKLLVLKKDNDSLIFSYSRENTSIEVALLPEDNATFAPGMITHVEMETKDGLALSFFPTKHDPQSICIKISTKELCEVPSYYQFTKEGSGQSLVKEICHKGTSDHFLRVIRLLSSTQDGALD